jgi:histidinol-phosphate aminotransferase
MGNLVIGSGIDDLLGLVVRAFVEQGTSVVTSLGSYPTFSYHVAGYGGALHFVPYRDYRNDLSGLAVAAIETGARLIYLANPDNPTGSWHGAGCLDTFLHEVPNNCVVLLDEAYGEFLLPEDVLPIIPEDPRVIRLRTFSKAHGMAGARIGYGIAAAEAITAFSKVRVQFGVNSLAQAGALASLDDSRFIASVITAVAEGRDEYYVLGQKLGMPALRSATNFVALDTGSASKAQYIKDSLLQRGVFVRVPGTAPLDQLIRVTVGTPGERTAFAEALRDLAEYLCLPGSEAPNSIESDSHGPGLRGSS